MNEFISNEQRSFRFKLGRQLASAVSGFIAGVAATTIVWVVASKILAQ